MRQAVSTRQSNNDATLDGRDHQVSKLNQRAVSRSQRIPGRVLAYIAWNLTGAGVDTSQGVICDENGNSTLATIQIDAIASIINCQPQSFGYALYEVAINGTRSNKPTYAAVKVSFITCTVGTAKTLGGIDTSSRLLDGSSSLIQVTVGGSLVSSVLPSYTPGGSLPLTFAAGTQIQYVPGAIINFAVCIIAGPVIITSLYGFIQWNLGASDLSQAEVCAIDGTRILPVQTVYIDCLQSILPIVLGNVWYKLVYLGTATRSGSAGAVYGAVQQMGRNATSGEGKGDVPTALKVLSNVTGNFYSVEPLNSLILPITTTIAGLPQDNYFMMDASTLDPLSAGQNVQSPPNMQFEWTSSTLSGYPSWPALIPAPPTNVVYGYVQWNVTGTGDLSQAELCGYDGTRVSSPTIVQVDFYGGDYPTSMGNVYYELNKSIDQIMRGGVLTTVYTIVRRLGDPKTVPRLGQYTSSTVCQMFGMYTGSPVAITTTINGSSLNNYLLISVPQSGGATLTGYTFDLPSLLRYSYDNSIGVGCLLPDWCTRRRRGRHSGGGGGGFSIDKFEPFTVEFIAVVTISNGNGGSVTMTGSIDCDWTSTALTGTVQGVYSGFWWSGQTPNYTSAPTIGSTSYAVNPLCNAVGFSGTWTPASGTAHDFGTIAFPILGNAFDLNITLTFGSTGQITAVTLTATAVGSFCTASLSSKVYGGRDDYWTIGG